MLPYVGFCPAVDVASPLLPCLLDNQSALNKADISILILDSATLYEGGEALSAADVLLGALDKAAACRGEGIILVSNIAPLLPDKSCQAWCDEVNRRLSAMAATYSCLFVLDVVSETMLAGAQQVRDPRLYYYGQIAFSPDFQAQLAWRICGLCMGHGGLRKKVIVTDLDNTLWGGLAGEDGLGGVRLGADNQGRPFRDVQLALKSHMDNGVILAIASKNDEAAALDIIDHHPGMMLRRDDFAAWVINWDNKAANLVMLAESLALGLDSFVFLDDQPAERALIRQMLPEVLVPELPEDYTRWPLLIRRLICFEALELSDEDRRRGALYRQRGAAQSMRANALDLESYLQQLQMQITCAKASRETVPRISQLILKTNQFNLTVCRHDLQSVLAMASSPEYEVVAVRVNDIFGDNGITGAAILHYTTDGVVRLDTFLLSCRVIGRQIEDVLFQDMVKRIRKKGWRWLLGTYVPSSRNSQVSELLERWGFVRNGKGELMLDLTQGEWPDLSWLAVVTTDA